MVLNPPRLLLLNPWIHDFAALNMWAKPLGLLKVAEYLSQFDCRLTMIDCLDDYAPDRKYLYRYPKKELPTPDQLNGFPRTYYQYGITEEAFLQQLHTFRPDAILVTSIMTYWYPGVAKAIALCKQIYPDIPVILGGIYAQLFPDHARRTTQADAVYTGEANDELKRVLHSFGVHLANAGPRRPWFDLGFYNHLPYAPLLTSNGCPYRCPYCACSLLHPSFSQVPAERVVSEIKTLATRGVSDFAFYDDALLYRAEDHIHPLLAALKENRQVRFHTPNGLHARYMTLPTARLMKRANFQTIRLSLETINAARQVETGNKISNDRLAHAIENLQSAGFKKSQLGVYLMLGLPDQPWEEVWAGVQFLTGLDVRIHLTELSPLPGTSTWQTLVERRVLDPAVDPLLTNNTVYASRFTEFHWESLQRLRAEVARVNQLAGNQTA